MLKKVLFVMLVALFAVGIASAQQLAGKDILGPHNVNGHGCASCHAPHSGGVGNGGTNAAIGENTLWGRDFYATTYTGISGNTIVVANGAYAATDPAFHTAACMSCHDGNQTHIIGMAGITAELVEGKQIPTYLNDGTESLKNDHPVDVPYVPGGHNWAGTVDATTGALTWSTTDGPTVAFTANYGRPVRFYGGNGTAGIGAYMECSTCHNPHSVNYAKSTFAGVANAVKPTNFFIRGWYNTDNAASNSGQQFCRSCHYSKSNEYVGLLTIPTT
jgi:formate-dependent nitrite reductase cytochrome c552 subunit